MKLNKKFIASGKLGLQILGAIFEWRPMAFWAFVLLLTPLSVGVSLILSPDSWMPCWKASIGSTAISAVS